MHFDYREKELAAVKINPAEVDIIANELDVTSSTDCFINPSRIFYSNELIYFSSCFQQLDKKVAERTLREHKGDAVAAVRHLLH